MDDEVIDLYPCGVTEAPRGDRGTPAHSLFLKPKMYNTIHHSVHCHWTIFSWCLIPIFDAQTRAKKTPQISPSLRVEKRCLMFLLLLLLLLNGAIFSTRKLGRKNPQPP